MSIVDVLIGRKVKKLGQKIEEVFFVGDLGRNFVQASDPNRHDNRRPSLFPSKLVDELTEAE